MTPKERAAMQQALEALIKTNPHHEWHYNAITALREALGNSLKPKCFADYQPNHAIDRVCASCAVAVECQTGEQPVSQEPVAWGCRFQDGSIHDCICPESHAECEGDYNIPLYAAPVRTKDLTDDELRQVLDRNCGDGLMAIARAVIAADRRKNK